MTATIHNLTDYRRRFYGLREQTKEIEKVLNHITDLENINLRFVAQDRRAQACLHCPDCMSSDLGLAQLIMGVPHFHCNNCDRGPFEITDLMVRLSDLEHDVLVYEP